MIKILQRLTGILAVVGVVFTSFLSVYSVASAQGLKGQACDAAGTALVNNCSTGGPNSASDSKIRSTARIVVNTLSLIAGAVSVIMLIAGGFRYIISNGDTNALQGAKNTILYAVVGLVVVLFAQVIARFVLSRLS